MIYMVEMALAESELHRRAEWEAWYLSHQKMLLTIPGFRASQRFEAMEAAASPFVALHEVSGPELFTSEPYRAKAGPGGTGEWQHKMPNWHRNLFTGVEHTPDVRMDQWLAVIEDGVPASRCVDMLDMQWMEAIGLDGNVKRRAIAVVDMAFIATSFATAEGVRMCKPLMPRITA
jgi:hypothetical protein